MHECRAPHSHALSLAFMYVTTEPRRVLQQLSQRDFASADIGTAVGGYRSRQSGRIQFPRRRGVICKRNGQIMFFAKGPIFTPSFYGPIEPHPLHWFSRFDQQNFQPGVRFLDRRDTVILISMLAERCGALFVFSPVVEPHKPQRKLSFPLFGS